MSLYCLLEVLQSIYCHLMKSVGSLLACAMRAQNEMINKCTAVQHHSCFMLSGEITTTWAIVFSTQLSMSSAAVQVVSRSTLLYIPLATIGGRKREEREDPM